MEAAPVQSAGKEDITVSLADVIQNFRQCGVLDAAKQISRIGNAGTFSSGQIVRICQYLSRLPMLLGTKIIRSSACNCREHIDGKSILGDVAFTFPIVSYVHRCSSIICF